MMKNKSYTFSLSENIFKKFKIICDECKFNRSKYVESMITTFVECIEKGNFDGQNFINEKLSDKIKELYAKENL